MKNLPNPQCPHCQSFKTYDFRNSQIGGAIFCLLFCWLIFPIFLFPIFLVVGLKTPKGTYKCRTCRNTFTK